MEWTFWKQIHLKIFFFSHNDQALISIKQFYSKAAV